MRLLLIINSLTTGGAEKNLVFLANQWAGDGYNVALCTFTAQNQNSNFTLHPQVRLLPLGKGTRRVGGIQKVLLLPRLIRALRSTIRDERPDIVVSFMDQANLLTLLSSTGLEVPVIVAERVYPEFSSLMTNSITPLRPLVRIFREVVYQRASQIVVQTERAQHYFSRGLRSRISVISNPLSADSYLPVQHQNKSRQIIAVGRLTSQKRFDLLIDAFAELSPRYPEWSVQLFGAGELQQQLEAQARARNVSDKIIFRGVSAAIPEELSRSSVFVMTSDYEGFPGALCEAMATGLACLASDCLTGPGELIEDGANGLLFPTGDLEILTQKLDSLLSDPGLRVRLGEAATRVRDTLNPAQILGQWRTLFSERAKKR